VNKGLTSVMSLARFWLTRLSCSAQLTIGGCRVIFSSGTDFPDRLCYFLLLVISVNEEGGSNFGVDPGEHCT